MAKVIYVGKKHIMSYLVYAISILGNQGELEIKARGKMISRAADLLEILKRYVDNVKYEIEIGSDELEDQGRRRNVSFITIKVKTESKA